MAVFKCKMCGGALEIKGQETVAVCEYCGTKQTLPKLTDDRKANLYDRANHFRRNNEFDKAMSIYESILNEDKTDAESYWSLVLCRYGIEYVEDPASHKRVPTVNRAQFTSVFMDEDYKSAVEYADAVQKEVYEAEARAIDEIQKGILEISQKEEPFDVFICYKETDNNGRRTPDSVLATELYHELTKEGFKVFFSRITLEDKLGTAYEPYIFAALNSAKVMVVLGTRPEHFNAVWVKNEWSRYLALIRKGSGKTLIPAYKDMDPYDLPEEFSHLQAQDMSKLGFMQDLVRGIRKIAGETEQPTFKEVVVTSESGTNTSALLERVFMFLEDGDWHSANEYCEKVLDIEPKNPEAYLGKLMAELHARKREDLAQQHEEFTGNANYQKIQRFADSTLKESLKGYEENVIYLKAERAENAANTEREYIAAASIYKRVSDYKDSKAKIKECEVKAEAARNNEIYETALQKMKENASVHYEDAIELFEKIPGWKDSDQKLAECRAKLEEIKELKEKYRLELERAAERKRIEKENREKLIKKIAKIGAPIVAVLVVFVIILNTVIIPISKYNKAVKFEEIGDYKSALSCLLEAGNYKDAKEKRFALWNKVAVRETVSAGYEHTAGLKSDGTVVATKYTGDYDYYYGQCNVSAWTDIVAVSAGDEHTVGLKSDGTVVAVGENYYGQCDVSAWTDIVAVSAGDDHTVGLKSDGTVVATEYIGDDDYYDGQCDVSDWTDIVAVSAGDEHTVGLKSDGTVVATEYIGDDDYYYGQCDVSDWTDIVAVSAGGGHTVGLKSDGTVVAVGASGGGRCDVSAWTDIVAVSAGGRHTVGIKSDGTVVATEYTGDYYKGQCDVSDWTDIVAVSAGDYYTVGLKSDGTVVAVGDDDDGQCDVSAWKNIKLS